MKITDIKFEKLRIKLKKPVVVSFGVIEYGESIILKIETDEGYCGFGEAKTSCKELQVKFWIMFFQYCLCLKKS